MTVSEKVLQTDVLIIGGGISGLVAANKAVEQGVKVLLVDKGVIPWTGEVPSSGGAFPTIPVDQVEARAKYIVEQCEYLNDQDWVYAYARESYPAVQEMAGWGDLFLRDISGKLIERNGQFRLFRTEMCLPILLGRALKKGVKVLNRVYVLDLLKQDGRVVGAVGFHYQTGDFYVLRSRAAIIACGGCNYKSRPLFHMNCGEGTAMAYHAGAELRNAEFGMGRSVSNKYTGVETRGLGTLRKGFENARGECLVDKYPQADNERRFLNLGVDAFYQELKAGRGPIYLNLAAQPDLAAVRYGPDNITHSNRTHGYVRMMQRLGIDVTRQKVEWTINRPNFGGSVRVDLDCQTTVPGLYAAGAAIILGSGIWGALSSGHLDGPLGFVVGNGFKAGASAAKAVGHAPKPVATTEVEKLKTEILASLGVKEGYSPYDAIREVQEIIIPLKNSYIMRKERLEKALELVEKVKAKLPQLKARDAHELVRCHEARSMLFNAEVFFRSALARTETRGTNRREDYPERDDRNWLKWIIVKKEDGKMALSKEPVPIERYKFKPGGVPSRADPRWTSLG
ncbi:MAG: FAD-binding protein [Chloroflexi bacterium]|nr:FAD-binding protein [Chloroflexota bacterium]